MNMMKSVLLAGASEVVFTELEGASGLQFHAAESSPAMPAVVTADEGGDAPTAQLVGDKTVADQSRETTLAIIDERRAKADTPERERFLDTMRDLVLAGGQLPRSGLKYHLRATLALAAVGFHAWVEQTLLREDVERVARLLPLSETQATWHVRGGPRADSIIGLARKTMDDMEANGVAVPRIGTKTFKVARAGFAELMGVPLSSVNKLQMVWRELSERIASGRLKLGAPFVDVTTPSRAERRAARETMKKVLDRRARLGQPIPASSQRGDRIDLDWLLDEAGIVEPRLREWLKCDPTFRLELSVVIRKVRLKPVHLSRIDPRLVSYGRLKEDGPALLREIYRADTPNAEPTSDKEEAWVANQLSFLNRAMKVSGRGPEDDAVADFGDAAFDAIVAQGRTTSVKGNVAYEQSMGRWKRIAKALTEATTFPASFAGALDAGMVATGIDAPTLAATIGSNKGLIHAWRRGGSAPTFQNVHLVSKIEVALGLVEGTLMKRLPKVRSSRTMVGGRKEVTLADGTVVQLSGLWRYMHPDAPMWPEDRLRDHVVETRERVYGVNTAHRVRQRAAMSNAYNLPEPDPSSPIWSELDDLVMFQTGLVDDGRHRNPESEWRSDATVKLHRGQITTFVRWLMLPAEEGGLGVPPDLISFSLILNYRIVLRYVTWRVTRAADLEVDGERIGPKVTATEKMLLFFFANLMDPIYGWLTQSRYVVQQPQVIGTVFRMPFIRAGKSDMEIIDDETCRDAEVMPAEIVAACSTTDGWKDRAAMASAHIRSTGSRFAKSFKLVRDPQLLIMPILRHQHPIAVGLRMVRDALDHARPIETSPYLHAVDYQRALAFLMLMLVVFRSATMRNLTWRSDGTGNVRRLADGWEIVVEAESFKNCYNPELFGPSWNRRDYERTLGNWGMFNEVMEYFVEKCRPILLGGRKSDLLFPPPKGRTDWSESNFNYLVTSFTRKWCVWNPRYKTGMVGVRAFGPHPARNIVATHIIRNHPTEERWQRAAQVLHTGVDKVRTRYGWVTSREELAKNDFIYQEASKLAASDAPLY